MSGKEQVCTDLDAEVSELRREGFRVDLIYPADDPHTAVLSRGNERVRLTTRPGAPPPTGTLPPFAPQFLLTRGQGSPGAGRAGMLYRDLVPGRLGGRYVASLICLPRGGPVADWVHFHEIAVQVLYVVRGWVRVIYEGQGPSFVMAAGDAVVQPPKIRHRVLESSPGLEVLEIVAPAFHATLTDHERELPDAYDPARVFGNQRFLHHVAAVTPWTPFRGAEAQETAIRGATAGLADLRTIRAEGAHSLEFPAHSGELVFAFTLEGSATLEFAGSRTVNRGDAFVIPPAKPWRLSSLSKDLRLLHVTTGGLRAQGCHPVE